MSENRRRASSAWCPGDSGPLAHSIGAAMSQRRDDPVAPGTATVAGVILAAGASRRFGAPKQLAEWAGRPLVQRACDTALAADLQPVVAVLGAHAQAVAHALGDAPVHCLINERWDTGMASSLRVGVDHIARLEHVNAVAVLLADQPLIDAAHVRALCVARAIGRVDIAATRYGQVLGAPAVFARALFDQLCALSGDRGAGAIIRAHASRVTLTCERGALDIDRPEDLTRARRASSPARPKK